jgi:sulfate permease, SulP family
MTGTVKRAVALVGSTGARLTLGDLLGGLAAAAVALPQSMGLGVALFLATGFDASTGALAGLVGAASLSLSSGLTGATMGMVSAPNGPVTMLLSVSLASIAAQGIQGEGILLALVAIMVLTGLLQFLLGITGGGQFVKFIPYPVIAGLVSGIGVLMVVSQLQPLSGEEAKALGSGWITVPAVTALVTFGSSKLVPRFSPRIPAIITGLVTGVVMFHLLMLAAPGVTPEAWMVGAIPGFDVIRFDVDASLLASLPWRLIVVSALTLTVLASVDCLLTAVIADEETGDRHTAGSELAAQGIGQIVAGLLGGIGGGGTKGATLVAIKSGGRRWTAVVTSLTFVLLILYLGPVGAVLPISALAGVIIYVGVGLLEWNILHWLRRRETRLDGVIALLVFATTLAFDLMVGVAVGVVGTVLLFVRRQAGAPVVHEHSTGKEHRSLLYRTVEERGLLDKHGDRIVYIELRGNLFFGTVDRLFTQLLSDLNRPVWMILNMRRVQSMDMSGLNLFRQMIKRLDAHGGRLIYSNVRKSGVMGRKMNKLLRWLAPEAKLPKVKTFKSTDAALEYAEDELLKSLGCVPAGTQQRVELDQFEIFRHLSTETREALTAVMQPLPVKRKKMVYACEEFGDSLYFILQGQIEIRLPTRVYHYKRLAKLGPGSFFGEDAFLDPSPRSDAAVVVQDAELLMIDRHSFESLMEERQREVGLAVLYGIGGSLSRHLRWTQSELRRLERW